MTTHEDSLSDPLVAQYYSLKPFNFHDVERIEVRQTTSDEGYTTFLDMEVRHINLEENRRLFLTFNGVLNLRLTPPMRMVIQIITLEVRSIKERQWEGANYSVKETEHDTVSFLCRDFTAVVR